MEDEVVIFEETVDFGDGEKMIVTVYRGEDCATFRYVGKRGGLKSMVTVPFYLMSRAMDYSDIDDYKMERERRSGV